MASQRISIILAVEIPTYGRPLLPKDIQALIRKMATDNPTWGESGPHASAAEVPPGIPGGTSSVESQRSSTNLASARKIQLWRRVRKKYPIPQSVRRNFCREVDSG